MVTLMSVENEVVKVELEINISGSMLDAEETLQKALNEAGIVVTREMLKRFDTDGSPILTGGIRWTAKGTVEKLYQTPYGATLVARHVYQTYEGGKTFCPLDQAARIVVSSTPRFAKIVSHKVADSPTTVVQRDLEENHGRHVSRGFVHDVAEAVGAIAQAKEETWHYDTPEMACPIACVAISMDGAIMRMRDDGWREAMTGTVALYDVTGKRQHTIYLGAAPEYGKASFKERMEREIAHVKRLYPEATYVGIADGALSNWRFLEAHTDCQIIDFWHVTQYLGTVAQAVFPDCEAERVQWLDARCHVLKHEPGAAQRILTEMEQFAERTLAKAAKEDLDSAITYFRNHHHQMHYEAYRRQKLPIGSGVTEAACKTLIKHRLCASGMKWLETGARMVLSLRALVLTKDRWNQFWSKIDRYGISVA